MSIGQWFSRIPQHVGNFFSKVLPNSSDGSETALYKRTVYIVFGMIFLLGFFVIAAFFLNLETDESTVVPNLKGKDLVVAIQELQEKRLTPKVQAQLSNDLKDKGKILTQEPAGGLMVKAGRTVTIVVSKGAIATNMDDYVGRDFLTVQKEINTLLSGGEYVINLKDPLKVSNPQPAGTILEQKPLPGTPITANTEVNFVISNGPSGTESTLVDLRGKTWQDALSLLSSSSTAFQIKLKKAEGKEVPGTVALQAPAPGSVKASGTVVLLTLVQPDKLPDDQLFGLFEYNLKDTAVPSDLKFEVKDKMGTRKVILNMKYPSIGGALTLPYTAKKGDVLILSVFNKEVLSQEVGK